MPDQENNNNEESETKEQVPEEIISETQHTVTIDGKEIAYTATAGTMILKEEDEESGEVAKASVFFVAYT